MSEYKDTGFGLAFKVDEKNRNIEIVNRINNSVTIITPTGTEVKLWVWKNYYNHPKGEREHW